MIIFNHLYNDYSGSGRVFCDLINSLKDINKKKVVITSSSAGFLQNIDVDEIHYNSFSASNFKIVSILSFFFSQIKSFFKIIFFYKNTSNKKDIVIVNNTIYNIGATLAAALLGIKVVMIVHELTVNKLFKFLTWNLYKKHVNDVIYVSKFLKKNLEISGPTTHILHNGLRADFNVSSDICLKKKFSQKKIVFVGSLKAYKGIYDLVILAKRLPNYKFIAAINSSQKEFNSFLQEIDSLDNMNFFCRPNSGLLSNFYEEAFILINLSKPDDWVETFGLTLLEGMSYGCPVIAPKIGGHLDYINESHGLIGGMDNIENIISFIHNLSSSMEDFTKMSKSCSQTALDFSSTKYNFNANGLFKSIFNKYNTQ